MQLNYIVWMLLAMQGIFSVTTTGNAPAPTCCTETSTSRVHVTKIAKYIHQDKPLCPIKAVRFLLRNNKTICSKPDDTWAKHAIKVLDGGTASSWSSTSRTETTTIRSSSRPSTAGTITMTTPQGSSTTWKSRTSVTRGSLLKQTPGNTNKPPQMMTTTQMTPIKMTTSTATTSITTEGKPSTTDIKTTSTSMTTESPVTTTATTLRPSTTVTQRYSTEQSTKAQITTSKVIPTTTLERKSLTPNIKTMSETMTTESQMTTSLSTASTEMTSMTTENRVTVTAPRGTSTTESPVKKLSTSNIKSRTTTCVPVRSSSTTKDKKLPWTVRRLRKKTKPGLRRAQMNLKVNIC